MIAYYGAGTVLKVYVYNLFNFHRDPMRQELLLLPFCRNSSGSSKEPDSLPGAWFHSPCGSNHSSMLLTDYILLHFPWGSIDSFAQGVRGGALEGSLPGLNLCSRLGSYVTSHLSSANSVLRARELRFDWIPRQLLTAGHWQKDNS